ncbi:HEAT repeat-containing protein 5B isoform X2 [Neocloeon triangulifer]|uniref:HEAT repeat-containing protein 5B isoform X2 n=1 Tax=Neocloeon triangulifer TaxID=2078957 RepID=UPI00286EF7E3|nr:HEAT repeat-containing protein 5B isoform X2 [Neocloeon triangulifer]
MTANSALMELSHSLILNEAALAPIPDDKKPIFILEWLRFVDKVLSAAHKADIKECQVQLLEQLMSCMQNSPGPPIRRLIGRCLATLFSVGDTFMLFETVNKCNDILKVRDDSPSFLPTRLAVICCLGCMYEKLGRMMGRSYEETLQILVKTIKNAESQTRIEIICTFEKICSGMGNAITNVHKEIYKCVKHYMTDRVMAVRCAAAKCLLGMLQHASFLYTVELENVAMLCIRSFDGSNYEVRCCVAKLLGTLIAKTQITDGKESAPKSGGAQNGKNVKTVSLEEALGILQSGFIKGSGAGFLKGTGEIIKGTSNVCREIRVGIAHSYVMFVRAVGPEWLERNMQPFLSHLLDLVANPKVSASHMDAVYSRKCISHVMRSTLGRMLGERAQLAACKELAILIAKHLSANALAENAKESSQDSMYNQHMLVCALQEIGCLLLSLGTTASSILIDASSGLINTTFALLVHPCQAARLSAAWCLRCICVAVPCHTTPLIDRCLERVESMRSSPEAIAGYSCALAAVLGGVRLSPLGVPHTKGKIIFNTAEELLRSASQNSRLSMNRTQAGWLLIGAIMTLGVPVVKGLLPRMLLLWRNSFPRSNRELESEKARGDAFTWQITLEGRSGALSAIHSLLYHCPELITDDIIRRLLTPIESALAMLTNISSVLKSYGQQLKAPASMVRLRLYETLSLFPSHSIENSYTHLLRLLVSEFTLAENPANTATSLLRSVYHSDDNMLLGSCLQENNHKQIEDQIEHSRRVESESLQGISSAGSGALEHDVCHLYRPALSEENYVPSPIPLGVAVIDQSLILFGQIFLRVAPKHKLQMLTHFAECIKQARSTRQEVVQLNVFTALLGGLKGMAESKTNSGLGTEEVKKAMVALIQSGLTSQNPVLRYTSGEAIGRLAQAVAEPRFTADLAQYSFDRLTTARDATSRTGHSLALGCLHKYVGGLGSSQHLNTSISILLALAQDLASPVVQLWSLHALALIADSGGPMFRGYVEPTLSLAVKLLLTVPLSHSDVHQCIAKVLAALITTIGPELQGGSNTVCAARSLFLSSCAVLQDHENPAVQAEATACLQQLHLFAPRHVNLSTLVPTLCNMLSSSHLLLRKAAVSCLRQLTQREAKEVCEYALTLASENGKENTEGLHINELGLPGVLFSMLDTESDHTLVSHIHDTLTSMLHILAAESLTQWLVLCKDVLTVSYESSMKEETKVLELSPDDFQLDADEDEDDNDAAEFKASDSKGSRTQIAPRWPTRVFAAQCVRRIIASCHSSPQADKHFDLAKAKECHLSKSRGGDFLVLHLAELVRMAFMAATSDSDPLRLEGLTTLQDVIEKFAHVIEPEFPGHLLLEQYQAQVGAALRPAFTADTPPTVTAAACEVCSTWIGSGVARDLNDLRRVHQLLVSSLEKLRTGPANSKTSAPRLYNESLSTLECLAILRAWAEIYIVAIGSSESGDRPEDDVQSEGLLVLVQPELPNLSQLWLSALRDHALLLLPSNYSSQLPHDGGAFYTCDTIEASRPHFVSAWPPLLHAVTLWLTKGGGYQQLEENGSSWNVKNANKQSGDICKDSFHLLFGICLEALCCPRSSQPMSNITSCLKALITLLQSQQSRLYLISEDSNSLAVELCNVLHRLMLTRDSASVQLLVMDALTLVLEAGKMSLEKSQARKIKELVPANQECDAQSLPEVLNLGEGGATGQLKANQSVVFAALEVCLCLLTRQLPNLNPVGGKNPTSLLHLPSQGPQSKLLIASALQALSILPNLCSPQGTLTVAPTLLYLATGVIEECALEGNCEVTTDPVVSTLHCLRSLASLKLAKQDSTEGIQMRKLLQSALGKLLDLAKTAGSDQNRLDATTVLLAIAVFILHCSPDVICTPTLLYPCVNHFKLCLESNNVMVRLQCIQTLRAVFQVPEQRVAVSFIHNLAPRLIEILHLLTSNKSQLMNENQIAVAVEGLKTLESLVMLAKPQNRMQLLSLLLPILVNCLKEEQPSRGGVSKQSQVLHEQSLGWLMRIAPQYPQDFKLLMNQLPQFRTRIQNAIKSSHTVSSNATSTANNKVLSQQHQQQPSIKLKTDFSNFASH